MVLDGFVQLYAHNGLRWRVASAHNEGRGAREKGPRVGLQNLLLGGARCVSIEVQPEYTTR